MTSVAPSPVQQAARIAPVVGALGVVFGDIGTSPLYALRECLDALPPAERADGILGALSLVFWTLLAVVNFKYMTFITRVDNRGEGGVFALLARSQSKRRSRLGALPLLVLFGAALLYGDGIITPAISVLGAAEGLESFSPGVGRWVPLIASGILALLFLVQSRGSKVLGSIFGPAMLVWFAVMGGLGLWHVVQHPEVLRGLNPLYGVRLLMSHPADVTGLLGSIVLVVTGAEALYADMGHFGRRNIARAWHGVAFPGLVLNYFGQGAWALHHPTSEANPFFALAPAGFAQLALTILSIGAAIIASQAMISGTFSLTRQAIQLGYFPRLRVHHTNSEQEGQIYVPAVNAALAVGSILTVFAFGSSSALAGAYGIAVTGTMIVTSLAFFAVARRGWHWSIWSAAALSGLFLLVDVPLFVANLHKITDGGWMPLAVAVLLLGVMHTWNKGKREIFQRVYANPVSEAELGDIARSHHLTRVRGSAVFMAGNSTGTPLVLLHHLKANKVLHDHVVLLTILTEEIPSVPPAERLEVRALGQGLWRAIGRYGYMESPDVNALLRRVRDAGVPIKPDEAVIYFNREIVLPGGESSLWAWQRALYSWISQNARPARDYYQVRPTQIIEIGLPVLL